MVVNREDVDECGEDEPEPGQEPELALEPQLDQAQELGAWVEGQEEQDGVDTPNFYFGFVSI